MKSPYQAARTTRGGFTLVEILVSFTILGLIMVGVAQMMSSALSATLGGYKHMDADTQARMVLDRMAFDISKITKRTDVDYFFNKVSTTDTTYFGNDQMAFYTEAGGYYPNDLSGQNQQSDTALVGYRIYNNQLVRLSKGLCWNASNNSDKAMIFNPSPTAVTNTSANTIPYNWPIVATGPSSTNMDDFQVIGDQVFRLEYCFLVQTPPSSSTQTVTIGGLCDYPSATSLTAGPAALKDVTAVVVSIAVLDSQSRLNLGSAATTSLQTASSTLPDDVFTTLPTGSVTPSTLESQLPLATWKAALLNTPHLNLPKAVWPQVRFYQRFCYLNHLQ